MHSEHRYQWQVEPLEGTEEKARALYDEWRLLHNRWEPQGCPSWEKLMDWQKDEWMQKAGRLLEDEPPAVTASEPLQSTRKSEINETKPRETKGKKVQQFDYPPPDTTAELEAIQDRFTSLLHASRTIASLEVQGVDAAPVQIAGLHEISSRTERLAREIGLRAIAEGKLSQMQLGRLLGVHQATVSRWISDAQQQQASGQ